jgi:hypothetical protein
MMEDNKLQMKMMKKLQDVWGLKPKSQVKMKD